MSVTTCGATAPTPAANLKLSCRNVQLNVNAPHAIIEDNSEAEWLNAYWVQGAGNTSFMLVNDLNHIEVWSLTSAKDSTPKDKKPLAGLNTNGEWSNFSIVDAAPVTDTKLIIAVTFWDPRPDNALYLLDVTDLSLTPLLTKDAGYSRDIKYFQVKPLSGDTGIVLFYSKQVRTAAEIYHNYLNHLLLVSPKYPTGAEILKLGIDIGNVKEWDLYGHTLYIKTLDNRKPDAPKEGLWSLDLSGML